MIAEELRSKGFAVVEASNSDEAQAILQTSARVDIVVSDVRMPGALDGLGLARWVREARPELKVVIASAHVPDGRPHELADAYFVKPYDVDRLVARLRELLTSR